MTEDERKRLAALEKTTQGFNLVTNRISVEGGFDKLKRNATDSERLAHLEWIHQNFQIVGGPNVTVEGSLAQGYAICATCPDTGAATGGGVPQPIPPTITGACCDDEGNCTVQSQAACESGGGAYQGDGTDCDPNPCPPPPEEEGACCREEVCTIETQADCEFDGGVYQGDDTTCDPNPCEEEFTGACCDEEGNCTVTTEEECVGTYHGDGTDCDPNPCPSESCDCATPFAPLDGSFGHFRTRTIESSGSIHTTQTGTPFDITTEWSSFNSGTCGGDCSCSGSGSSNGTLADGSPYSCTFSFSGCGGSSGTFVGSVAVCGYSPSCWTPGANAGATSESNSRTTRHSEWDLHSTAGGFDTDWSATQDITLSDECIP